MEFGLKELTDLTLKATYPIEVEGRTFEEGEVIARFDKIQLANFQEIASRKKATGGFDNRTLVTWEDSKEIQLSFTHGVFSKTQFALLNNAKLISHQDELIYVSTHVSTESDENGKVLLGKKQVQNVFVYDAQTGQKLRPVSINFQEGELSIKEPYQDVEIDFEFVYNNGYSNLVVGRKLTQGYLQLEGKMKVKDDLDGKVRTAILRIPRLKLVSDLSMRLGREATPMATNFNAIGVPVGDRKDKVIMELLFLNDDIDAEIQ